MVVGRVFRATACPNCRISIVRSFASLSGPPIRTPHPSTRAQYPTSARARFSSNIEEQGDSHGLADEAGGRNITEGAEQAEGVEGIKEAKRKEEPGEVSTVPWYLQVDTPQRKPQPLLERQQIPDLPKSPPPILLPLLQRLSVELGLDNLSLIDLRKLDPPPALGANLMMVIGTARSERHLHVSADRLCRWLRSTYRLRPDADGLLGRNELKMKLRRKARRAKLLGSVAEDNDDDGVRTGWVCVDAGIVETTEPLSEAESESHKFVGFGRQTDGVRVVVQMLTEEKREEIDLEGLWGGVLKRGMQRQFGESEGVDSGKLSNPATLHSTALPGSNGPSSMPSQSRGFHTSAFRLSAQLEAQPDTRDSFAEASFLQFGKDVPQLQNKGWRILLLEQQRAYLESIPRDATIGLLGTGYTDRTSTPFLTNLYQNLPEFFSEADGKALIDLYCYAMDIGHMGYTLTGLMGLLNRLQLKGVAISSTSYLQLLRAALGGRPIDHDSTTGRESVDKAMRILQAMYDQGHKVLTEQVFVVLQETLAHEVRSNLAATFVPPSTTLYLQSKTITISQRRLHMAMMAVDIPFFQDETRLRLLNLYSQKQHWLEFWDVWRMAPRHGKPQTSRMYDFMFRTVAATNNQKGCMEVLRVWVPEMDVEIPKVLLEGAVAEAVKAMLKVADPYVEEEAKDPTATGEWIDLWRRTMQ